MKCNMKYIVVFIFFFCILEEVHAKSRVEYRKMPCTMLQGITEREYTIYLPDDYYLSDTCSYPVLYLLHGGIARIQIGFIGVIYRWLLTLWLPKDCHLR